MAITTQNALLESEQSTFIQAPEGTVELTFEELVDKIGALKQELAAVLPDPRVAQLALLEADLIALASSQLAKDEPAQITGKHYTGKISACVRAPSKIIDMKGVQKYMGEDLFMKLAKVTISDINKYLVPSQIEKVMDMEVKFTDRRTLSIAPIE